MSILSKGIIFMLAGSMLASCGGSSGGGNDAEILPGEQGVVGQAFSKAEESIKTVGTTIESSKLIQALSAPIRFNSFDPHCSGLGTSAQSTADYIGCILQNNDGSPETILGAMNLVSEIISGIESNVTLTYPASALTTENLTFTVDTSDGEFTAKVSIREVAGDSSPWTQVLDICMIELKDSSNSVQYSTTLQDCINNGFSVSIQLRSTNTQLAFRFINRFMGDYESTSFMIDSSADEMRFESWSFANSNHTRGYVSGNVSTDLVLDDVSTVAAASAYDDSGNWGGVYGVYDGTNICMNYESSTPADDQFNLGACGSYPEYDDGFHDFSTGAAAFEAWADDTSKGLLNFDDSSFDESSLFIDV